MAAKRIVAGRVNMMKKWSGLRPNAARLGLSVSAVVSPSISRKNGAGSGANTTSRTPMMWT